MGGDLSYAVAMLDAHNNGVILSSVFGREGSQAYAKPIENGSSTYKLTEEEQQAAHQDEQDEQVKVEYSEESSTDPDMYADEPVNDEFRDPESGNSEVPAEE